MNYIESELNISVKEVLAPLILSSILKNRDSFIAVTQDTFPCLSQAENVYSQSYSQSYLVDSQLHTQTLPRYSNIQRGSFISAEDFLMIETLLETNLSLTGDAGVAAESTIAEVSELDLLATMSDEYLKQKVIDKLGDPEFIKFVERIDKLLEKNGINPSV